MVVDEGVVMGDGITVDVWARVRADGHTGGCPFFFFLVFSPFYIVFFFSLWSPFSSVLFLFGLSLPSGHPISLVLCFLCTRVLAIYHTVSLSLEISTIPSC